MDRVAAVYSNDQRSPGFLLCQKVYRRAVIDQKQLFAAVVVVTTNPPGTRHGAFHVVVVVVRACAVVSYRPAKQSYLVHHADGVLIHDGLLNVDAVHGAAK